MLHLEKQIARVLRKFFSKQGKAYPPSTVLIPPFGLVDIPLSGYSHSHQLGFVKTKNVGAMATAVLRRGHAC